MVNYNILRDYVIKYRREHKMFLTGWIALKWVAIALAIFLVVGFSGINLYDRALQDISLVPKDSLNTAKQSIASGTLRVAFYGDSITEGADQTNQGDAYPRRVEQLLRDSLPSTNIVVQNFSLGGRNLAMATSADYKGISIEPPDINQGFNRPWSTIGKSWIDHVKTFQPDLIVLAFGMNDASQPGTDDVFAQKLEVLRSTINEWSKVPNVIVVPVFPQTKDYARFSGTADSQMITQSIARATREYGRNRGWAIADVNRLYNILLNGFDDVTRASVAEIDFSNYSTQWFGDTSSFTLKNGILNPTAPGKSIARSVDFYNGSIEFTIKPSASSWDGMIYVQYRNSTGFGSMGFYVFPGTNGFIQLNADNQNLFTSQTINIPLNTDTKFKLIATGSHHKIYVNDVLITDLVSYKKLNNGGVILGSTGMMPTLSNFKISTLLPIKGSPLYTEDDLLGPWNSPFSGNGINHPSGLGHALFYEPAFYGTINGLKR